MNYYFFFFKQKTAYEIVSRDWSSDVCSSDLCSDSEYDGVSGTHHKTISILGDTYTTQFGVHYTTVHIPQ